MGRGAASEVTRERIQSIRDLVCYGGIIGSTGVRVFQLDLPVGTPVPEHYLSRFRGVEVALISLTDNSLIHFTLLLIDEELQDVFTLFVEDVIEKLVSISNHEEALLIIHQCIHYWKNLFAKVGGALLSPEQQRGLYGELMILERLLSISKSQAVIVDAWRGPLSANQDFAIAGNAIEVKTTVTGHQSVKIANEHQLDSSGWNRLCLAVIQLIDTSGQKSTLTGKVRKIVSLLASQELVDFFYTKLNALGYNQEDADDYDEVSYIEGSSRYYSVTEDFPAITAGDFQDTPISSITYTCDISACGSFEITELNALNSLMANE